MSFLSFIGLYALAAVTVLGASILVFALFIIFSPVEESDKERK